MNNTSLESFIETALWSTLDYYAGDETSNPPLDERYTIEDVSESFKEDAQKMIDQFLELATPLFTEDELESAPICHDLWLTLEGHGAGFWDGDYKNGNELTELCNKFGKYSWGDRLNESINREANHERP